jgi:aarF domain-containing kinase
LVHRRAARRLLQLCQTNKGVYIKDTHNFERWFRAQPLWRLTLSNDRQVGQHLASLDYLIPHEYIETLSTLFDDNPRTSIDDVRQVVLEELGQPIETLFASFDPVPIASASLAQVHVAYEHGTGRKLAVKVQHRGLRETSAGDLFALVSVVRVAELLFDDFKWGWLADEIAPQLPKELDFVNEGKNAERAARNLAETGLDCVVPKIVWRQTSPRVLTMEFEEGFKATDVAAIERHGFRKKDVARLISSVFSSQVFTSGFVHCDPHPANVVLRPNRRDGTPQLVLVDHGLYRELDATFRQQYARLWKSLMLADLNGIRDACRELGVERTYALFAAVLTARPFDELIERSKNRTLRAKVQSSTTTRADQAVIRGYAHRFLHDIFDLLGSVPRQMLLLLKMNDCLRHIDLSLGSPTNTMVICGKYAAMSVYTNELQTSTSVWERLNAWWDYVRVVLRIHAHDATVWWLESVRGL